MRAHEILVEYEAYITDDYLAKVAKTIKANCGPYLKYKSTTPFYRGMRTQLRDLTEFTTLKNRAPKDMPLEIHQYLDNWFSANLGNRWRSNATFATGSSVEAIQYGFPYVFFPIGNFDFCWSEHFDDLFSAVDSMLSDNGFGATFRYEPEDIKRMEPLLIEMLQTYKVNDSLIDAADSRNEVLFNCEKYFLLPPSVYYGISNKYNLYESK